MKPQSAKQLVFLLLALLAVALLATAIIYADTVLQNAALIAVAVLVLLMVWKLDFLLTLKEYERAVVFRFGRLSRVAGPGWAFILPPFESCKVVDLRTHTIDIPPQEVVTKDNIELKIDAVIYLKVMKDNEAVIKSVVEVEDYENAAKLYVKSMIRDIIGSMMLSGVISNIESLNTRLKEGLRSMSEKWGVEAESVEITDIKIPKAVVDAMHNEKAAEQNKLARMESADAHRAEIDAVKQAAEQLSDRALSYYYIRALEKMAEGKATKIIFPIEISRLAELLGGKMGSAKSAPAEQLVQQYAPLLLDYITAEKQKRENAVKKKK